MTRFWALAQQVARDYPRGAGLQGPAPLPRHGPPFRDTAPFLSGGADALG
jgi:hypothetical protein